MNRIIAIIVSILLLPLYLLLTLGIIILIGRPIIFKQKRPGLKGKIFELYKFRSMSNTKDKQGNLLPDIDRIGRFGQILRSSSLDELPSLLNVVKGEMNWIGPRPLLVEYLPLYSQEQAKRHTIKPGITGWAQVNGRNVISWKQKFELDVWYVNHRSFWLDVKILLMTIKKIFVREGISANNHVTIEKFQGNS